MNPIHIYTDRGNGGEWFTCRTEVALTDSERQIRLCLINENGELDGEIQINAEDAEALALCLLEGAGAVFRVRGDDA